MDSLKHFLSISTLIIGSVSPSCLNAALKADVEVEEEGSFSRSAKNTRKHISTDNVDLYNNSDKKVEEAKQAIHLFYDDLYQKLAGKGKEADAEEEVSDSVFNVEEILSEKEEFQEITTENAAQVLFYAIKYCGDAPQADEIFNKYYDPFGPNLYEPYTEPRAWAQRTKLEPETDEEEDRLAELNVGLATEWPNLPRQMRKISKDNLRNIPRLTEETNADHFQPRKRKFCDHKTTSYQGRNVEDFERPQKKRRISFKRFVPSFANNTGNSR